MGLLAGIAPKESLVGEEQPVALLHWRSSKTPRQCLGSNGAEVEAIREGEDSCFRLRLLGEKSLPLAFLLSLIVVPQLSGSCIAV